MNILLLGDIVGPSGRKAISEKLPILVKKNKIDFVILNGENAADPGVGITKEIVEEFWICTFVVEMITGKLIPCSPLFGVILLIFWENENIGNNNIKSNFFIV